MVKRKLNWRPGLKDHRDKLFHASFHKLTVLPAMVDLAPGMSPVQDQGELGCCVGESSNAAVEYIERQYGIDSNFFGSVLYCYYNARQDKANDGGAEIKDSIKAMAKLGVAHQSFWPFIPKKFSVKPSAQAYADGPKQIIRDYLRLSNLEEIRQALAQHHPVLIGFTCYDSLQSPSTAKSGVVPMPRAYEGIIGGHAICLVGYDDSKKLLKFKNSWGTSWGLKGYGFLPYDYIGRLSDDYWVIRK